MQFKVNQRGVQSFIDFVHTPHRDRISYSEWAYLSKLPVKEWTDHFANDKHEEAVLKQILEDRKTEPYKQGEDKRRLYTFMGRYHDGHLRDQIRWAIREQSFFPQWVHKALDKARMMVQK